MEKGFILSSAKRLLNTCGPVKILNHFQQYFDNILAISAGATSSTQMGGGATLMACQTCREELVFARPVAFHLPVPDMGRLEARLVPLQPSVGPGRLAGEPALAA